MNADVLLEHFHRLGDAPDAVPRLRRFILDLAVRGKLVTQVAKDEPASALLKKIEVEKARLHKAGEIGKPKSLPPIEPDEEPYQVPKGWLWTRMRQVTTDRGQTVPRKTFTYIDVTAIDKEAGVVADAKVLEAADAPSRARKAVAKGDVIYSCVRPTLLNVAIIDHAIKPAPIASTAFAVLNGFGLVLPKYLWITLRSPFMVACVEEKMRGQAYPSINDGDFSLLPFPLPPLAEQHRIVAKVDELMALCDRLEAAQQQREQERTRLTAASWQALVTEGTTEAARFALEQLPALTTRPAQVKALRQTILDLAVRGKLVEQDAKDEPAEVLLKRIAKDRGQGVYIGKDWGANESGAIAEAFSAPKGWKWTRIAATVQRVTVGFVGSMKDQYVKEGVPFLRSQNVRANQFRPTGLVHISVSFHKTIIKSAVVPGDVVVVRSGNVGTACVVPDSIPNGNCSDLVVVQRPIAVNPAFLCFYLNSLAAEHIEAGAVGVALTHFNTKSVANMPLPLPPLAEQGRIVAKVEALMGLCDRLEAALVEGEAVGGRLLEAVLAGNAQPTLLPA